MLIAALAAVVIIGLVLCHNFRVSLFVIQFCGRVPTWIRACCAARGADGDGGAGGASARSSARSSAPAAKAPPSPMAPPVPLQTPPPWAQWSSSSSGVKDEERGDIVHELSVRTHALSDEPQHHARRARSKTPPQKTRASRDFARPDAAPQRSTA